MKIRKPSRETARILKMIALGVFVVGIGAVPSPRALGAMFRELQMKDTKVSRQWMRRRLRALHEQRYVSVRDEKYSLSEIGQRLIKEDELWSLSVQRPKKWDGEWHLVVFDIPKQKARTRIPFVRMLQNLGFVYYQRSIWIHAFPAEDEVREIALFHDILPFVSFIKAVHVDGSHILRKHFKIT